MSARIASQSGQDSVHHCEPKRGVSPSGKSRLSPSRRCAWKNAHSAGCWVLWSNRKRYCQRSSRQPLPIQLASSASMNSRPRLPSRKRSSARDRAAGQAGAGEQRHVVGLEARRLGLGERVQGRLDQAEAAPAAGGAPLDQPDPRLALDRAGERREVGRARRGRRSGRARPRRSRRRPGCGRARPPARAGRGRGSGTGASSGARAAVGIGGQGRRRAPHTGRSRASDAPGLPAPAQLTSARITGATQSSSSASRDSSGSASRARRARRRLEEQRLAAEEAPRRRPVRGGEAGEHPVALLGRVDGRDRGAGARSARPVRSAFSSRMRLPPFSS